MKQVFNPFLPSYEYIPDAEPRVFDGRVYIYGSHDLFNGKGFCLGDYITYSAPIDDLSSWRYEGVIYKKEQDPMNKRKRALYAPDCILGPDGKYYLYYSVNASGVIGVATSDKPAGPFEFYSYVKYKDGTILGKKKGDGFQFDPGIYVEGENVYLYSGFCPGGFVGSFGIIGGGGWSFYKEAKENGCDIYISGDVPHHGRREIISAKFNYLDVPHEIENAFMNKFKSVLLDINNDLNITTFVHEFPPELIEN